MWRRQQAVETKLGEIDGLLSDPERVGALGG
jgi:hypothetical protein